jgi:hypothetical protein
MAALGLPSVPASVADVLRFGRCVDTAAIAASGFEPERSTDCCVRSTARRP